jgi:hypothetical protein
MLTNFGSKGGENEVVLGMSIVFWNRRPAKDVANTLARSAIPHTEASIRCLARSALKMLSCGGSEL